KGRPLLPRSMPRPPRPLHRLPRPQPLPLRRSCRRRSNKKKPPPRPRRGCPSRRRASPSSPTPPRNCWTGPGRPCCPGWTAKPKAMTVDDQQVELQQAKEGVIMAVHARPGAAASQVAGVHGGALKIRIQAPPVEGKANKALTAYIAQLFGLKPAQVTLVSGHRHGRKRVLLAGMSVPEARKALARLLAEARSP